MRMVSAACSVTKQTSKKCWQVYLALNESHFHSDLFNTHVIILLNRAISFSIYYYLRYILNNLPTFWQLLAWLGDIALISYHSTICHISNLCHTINVCVLTVVDLIFDIKLYTLYYCFYLLYMILNKTYEIALLLLPTHCDFASIYNCDLQKLN